MKIYIGGDHRGFSLKEKIKKILERWGHDVTDVGTDTNAVSCDYPRIGSQVAQQVAKKKGSRGILICMTGIGQAIVANKVRGAYAVLCYNPAAAVLSREHNNANVLVLDRNCKPCWKMDLWNKAWN